MAEPQEKDPYDHKFGEEDEQAVSRPDLRAIEGGGETTEPVRGHLGVAGKEKSKSPEELGEAEKGGGFHKSDKAESDEQGKLGDTERQIGGGFKPGNKSRLSRFTAAFSGLSRRKKIVVGVGAGGGIVGIIIGIFMSLLPLKILHIVNNLQSHFFAPSENVVEQRVDNLFDAYMKRHVLRGLTGQGVCASTRTMDKSCIKDIPGNSMGARLFRGWLDARFEQKLANDYGIEISKNPQTNRFTVKVPNTSNIEFDDSVLDGDQKIFGDLGPTDARKALQAASNEALEGASRWKRVMYRLKVGGFSDRNYGTRRCSFVCKITKNKRAQFDEWKNHKKTAAKIQVVNRVVAPHNQNLAIALECILSGECVSDPKPDGADNKRRDEVEKKITKVLQDNGFEVLTKQVDEIAKLVEEISSSRSLTAYLASKLFPELFNKYAAKAERGIPIVGWIITASNIIDTLHDAPAQLKRWSYALGASAAVGTFVLYRAQADEVKNGAADAELLGSMASSLGDTANGKGQTAEISPLYGELLGSSTTKASLLDIISPSAYAQAQANEAPRYTCDDGNPIKDGELVCPEEKLGSAGRLSFLEDFFNTPPFNLIAGAAGAVTDAISKGTGALCGIPIVGKVCNIGEILLGLIPGPLKNAIEELMGPLMTKLAELLLPSAVSGEMSGARAFSQMASGADVLGNDYAHYGLGGQGLTDQQVADIRNVEENKALQEFASKSFFARLFSKDTPYSFASRVSLALPSSYSNIGSSSFGSLVSNPFSKLIDGFGSLFNGRRGFAAATADPFGVPQFGYPLNAETEAIVKQNPDIYTDEYCAQVNKDWAAGEGQFENTIIFDEDTGTDIHIKPNPCLLEAAATGAAGGYFTDEVLTKVDLSDPIPSAPSGSPTTGGGTASSCTLTRDKMVEQILGHQGELLQLQNPGSQTSDLENPNKTTDKLVCLLWSVLEQGEIPVSLGAINSDHSPGGLHVAGQAIDFAGFGRYQEAHPTLFKWLYDNSDTLGIDELIFDPVPDGTHTLKSGNDCDTCYKEDVLAQHRDHVHAGVLP